uniref:hypothetical protein n=1 Tax=Brachybacterium sp. GPGPB12 TaxID=3023517 RepID=UPI00404B2C93
MTAVAQATGTPHAPGVWADVVGQDAAVAQFRRAASPEGSLAQAWLITGPPGSGRSTAARAFAATLQCEQGTGRGQCPACRTTLAGTHPDVTVVATDKLSIAKEEVRSLVMTAQRAPATGRHRVLIVEDADRMTAGTFNAAEVDRGAAAVDGVDAVRPLGRGPRPHDPLPRRLVTLTVPDSDVVAEPLRRRDGIEDQLALRAARAAQGHIGLAPRYATQEGALGARVESARTPLTLRTAGGAVLAAQALVERATAEAKEHADQVALEEKERFLRSAGIDDGKVPPSLRSQMRQLEEDAKRRQTRLVRDVLDRYLLDAHSVARDVLSRQLATGSELVNVDVTDEIEQAAANGTGRSTLAPLEAVQEARQRIAGNVPPPLAVEAAARPDRRLPALTPPGTGPDPPRAPGARPTPGPVPTSPASARRPCPARPRPGPAHLLRFRGLPRSHERPCSGSGTGAHMTCRASVRGADAEDQSSGESASGMSKDRAGCSVGACSCAACSGSAGAGSASAAGSVPAMSCAVVVCSGSWTGAGSAGVDASADGAGSAAGSTSATSAGAEPLSASEPSTRARPSA